MTPLNSSIESFSVKTTLKKKILPQILYGSMLNSNYTYINKYTNLANSEIKVSEIKNKSQG